MKLYKSALIESAEQAEALPDDAIVIGVETGERYTRTYDGEWWGVTDMGTRLEVDLHAGDTVQALVPIEAEEETEPGHYFYRTPGQTRLVTPPGGSMTTIDRDQLRADVDYAKRLTGTWKADGAEDYYPCMDRIFDAIPQLLDALDQAEHERDRWHSMWRQRGIKHLDAEKRATRAEARAAIRGRAVAIYQQRAREAKERIQAVEDALDGYTKFIHVEHIRAALEATHQETA